MHRRLVLVSLVALVAVVAGWMARAADARIPARHVKVHYTASGGITGTSSDLKVYDNRDAVFVGRFGTLGPTTLRLTPAEYGSLLALFRRYDFDGMPSSWPDSGHVADGVSYGVTLYTGGVAKTVESQTGAAESRGFRTIRDRLQRLALRVGEEGSQAGAAQLAKTFTVTQVGDQVRMTFKVTNNSRDPVNLTQTHMSSDTEGQWAELEAWKGGRKVWSWSDGRTWVRSPSRPYPLEAGASVTLSDEWSFTDSMTGLYDTFTFKARTFGPELQAQKTMELGRPLTHPHGNARVIDASMDGKTVEARVGDVLEVRLDGNPTTGYEWKTVQSSRSLPVSDSKYVASGSGAVGSGGVYVFTIKPDAFSAGNTHHFKFAYFRSFEGADHAVKTFTLAVKVLKDEPAGPQVVDEGMNGKTVEVRVGDTLEVRLAGNATTGYKWAATRNTRSLPVNGPEYVPSTPGAVGSGGTYVFTIKPDSFAVGHTHHFTFAYFRPFEGAEHAAKTFDLDVKVLKAEAGAPGGPGINDGLDSAH